MGSPEAIKPRCSGQRRRIDRRRRFWAQTLARGLLAWQCDGRREVREPGGLGTERSGGGGAGSGRTGAGGSRNEAP